MLDEQTRTAVLKLHEQGNSERKIAKALGISRDSVQRIVASQVSRPPAITRKQLAEPLREQVIKLHAECKGNLVRVHEELVAGGATLSYPALTHFCRNAKLFASPTLPSGQYHFGPGEEMQHDTSPHEVMIGNVKRKVQTASLVLCYSRMLFIQLYPTFNRFYCKVFLTDALGYFKGAAQRCMIDNTHVVVASGSGRTMVPAPEMAAFAQRFGFEFVAHEIGDANRSARVERPFHYVENNFLAGRTFADWQELNTQAVAWCDKVNAKYKRTVRAVPRELFAADGAKLRPLPIHVPEVYQLFRRSVDDEGYINLHTNRYSAPWELLGRELEVRESRNRVEIFRGPHHVGSHVRIWDSTGDRVTDPAHRPPRGEGAWARAHRPKEIPARLQEEPVVQQYLLAFAQRHPDKQGHAQRRLLRLLVDYPKEPLREAVAMALQFGLFDLVRLEKMVIQRLQKEFFTMGDPGKE